MAEPQRRVAVRASDSFGDSAASSAAASVTHVLLVTSDDELWIELKELAGPAYNIQQADSIAQAIESTPPGQVGIVVWDICSEELVNRGLAKLQHHSASLVPIVIDKDPARDVISALVRQRALLGRLTLPLVEAQVSVAMEAAREEANARAALFGASVRSSSSGSFGLPVKLIAVIAVVAALLGAGFYWFKPGFIFGTSQPVNAAAKTVATPTATAAPAASVAQTDSGTERDAQSEQIEPLLAKARAAMRDKRYDEPENDSALAYFRNVLLFDSTNGEADQGLERIAEMLLVRAETALEQRNYDNALRSIETARSIRPNHPRLAALDAQINQHRGELALGQIQAAMQAQSFDRAQQLIRDAQQTRVVPADVIARLKTDLTRRQSDAEMSDILKLLQARLQQGRLIEPAEDSAKSYLAAARKRVNAGSNAQLQSLSQDFIRALLQEARAAAGRQQPADVDRWLGEAKDAGVPARDIQALQRDLAQQAQKSKIDTARTAQLISDRIGQGRLLEPATDSALFYLNTLKTADAKNAALPDLTRRLAAELVNAARAALDGGQSADANSALQGARALGAVASDVTAIEQRIAHNKALEAQRALVVSAGTLKLTRAISPVYPDDALRAGTEGWVELQFTVDPEGKVTDVEVINSQPKALFDRAAINAMRHARYQPVLVDGEPVSQRARFKIAFRVDSKN